MAAKMLASAATINSTCFINALAATAIFFRAGLVTININQEGS